MNSPLEKAGWISSPFAGGPRSPAPAPYFRKTFTVARALRSARLTITALGLYDAEINGRTVGDQVFAPGWTDYRVRVPCQTYDVTSQLEPGENVLGAVLGDGWYCGQVAWKGRHLYGDRPRLLAALELAYRDGSQEIIVTDSSWKTSTGPVLQNDLLMGEDYDARLELGAWSQPGYDDKAWHRVLVGNPGPLPEIVEPLGPPVRRIEEIQPTICRNISVQGHHCRTYDFRQNFSGRVRIRVKADAGTVLTIRHSEVLNPDGSLYTENLRLAKATDYYTCKGGGEEVWEPRFTFHGFRYAEVESPASQAEDFLGVTGIVLHSDIRPTGYFSCSNGLLNQLQHNIVWGQKSNFLEVPTDCPQRDERLGWTGDAQVFVRTACFNMDVRSFFHKWMRDARDAQSPAGAVPSVIPDMEFIRGREDGGPAWSDATIICPWTIYLCYGDLDILKDHYGSMRRYLDFLKTHRCKDLIRSHPDADDWGGYGDWLALDDSGKTEGGTPRDLIGTAFFAHDVRIMAQVATVLGHHEDALAYQNLLGEIVAAFQNRFLTPGGLLTSATQTSYVLALQFGLIPGHLQAAAANELVRDIAKRGFHIATGFVGTPYILDVLEAHGHLDTAYKLLEQETFPSWLFPVKNGATTIWERWDGWTPKNGFQNKDMNSFNHYAYGAVGAWMYRTVAGLDLDPSEPGYRHVIFRPRPGGSMTWAEAGLKTPHGETSIRWELTQGKLHVDLCVPEGCHAHFSPPPGFDAPDSGYPAGTHHLILDGPPPPHT
ncbi:MAG: family 78 glycoside hydrolase catalytic domain [Terrimicrobiaceae bacterium]